MRKPHTYDILVKLGYWRFVVFHLKEIQIRRILVAQTAYFAMGMIFGFMVWPSYPNRWAVAICTYAAFVLILMVMTVVTLWFKWKKALNESRAKKLRREAMQERTTFLN